MARPCRLRQIAALARGLSDGTLSDAQAGALAMAIVLRGMDAAETAALTLAMRDSGQKAALGPRPCP